MCDPCSHTVSPQQWRPTATRLAVLIADAPPHGIGEVSGTRLVGTCCPPRTDPHIVTQRSTATDSPMALLKAAILLSSLDSWHKLAYPSSWSRASLPCPVCSDPAPLMRLAADLLFCAHSLLPCSRLLPGHRPHHLRTPRTPHNSLAPHTRHHRRSK